MVQTTRLESHKGLKHLKEICIAPREALKRLRAARRLRQTVYICGATGYGKTELVKRYLANRRYHHFSCGEGTAGLGNVREREWKELAGEAGGKGIRLSSWWMTSIC